MASEKPRKSTGSEASAEWEERRRERREPAGGDVLLMPEGNLALLVWGAMVDVSGGGFRARHTCSSLETGTLVRFRHSAATGVARVVWNRSANGTWESGFLVVERGPLRKRRSES